MNKCIRLTLPTHQIFFYPRASCEVYFLILSIAVYFFVQKNSLKYDEFGKELAVDEPGIRFSSCSYIIVLCYCFSFSCVYSVISKKKV